MIDVDDPWIRREIQARLERERERNGMNCREAVQSTPAWIWHVFAHVSWLLVQAAR